MFAIMSKSFLAVSKAVLSRTVVPVFPSSLSTSTTTTTTTSRWIALSATIPRSQQASTTTTETTSTETTVIGSLDAFRDTEPREKRIRETVGRSWTVKELRRKSFEDCHKLWYVLYKERNMLLTEMHLARRHSLIMPQPERLQKVKKSMGAIRHVLGERKREKLAAVALRRSEAEEAEKGSTLALDDDEGGV